MGRRIRERTGKEIGGEGRMSFFLKMLMWLIFGSKHAFYLFTNRIYSCTHFLELEMYIGTALTLRQLFSNLVLHPYSLMTQSSKDHV